MKYSMWLEEWMDDFVRMNVRVTTMKIYEKNIRNHIIPMLGDVELSEITALSLQKFIVNLSKEGLASNTVNCIISLVKRSLNTAHMTGIVEANQTRAIVRPKIKEKPICCFAKKEQQIMEKYIIEGNHFKYFGVIISLYTGVRIGELLALKWEDVDFKKHTIRINKSCCDSWKDNEYVKLINLPKTQSSERIIPIPTKIVYLLKNLKSKTQGEYLIQGRTKYGAEIRTYQKSFKKLLKKLNLPERGFHSLRHTFATRALECGMDVRTLSDLMGHKNPDITLRRYAHSMYEHKTEYMNKLANELRI